tara:strand:+ start:449 stop:667 length:219 start_codon:yes stop_codon:yes gene_type:complete
MFKKLRLIIDDFKLLFKSSEKGAKARKKQCRVVKKSFVKAQRSIKNFNKRVEEEQARKALHKKMKGGKEWNY